ncbi:isoleucine--tRNA ligase [Alkalihalobacillus trypoxylicola]|uniref:Isoleucine--tRNA ligase n=1 Tax=Alkalihalobacillus trypoxylicola TaxID=519424 RepID=A0A162CQD4_9BACI|nr:isoleucine--tRNA ligase [Alkalihalobacillus trypoxylicola]KYG26004.1 isoleucine--tRNA ligase [Alkalihalobacillus trypoxylicola]
MSETAHVREQRVRKRWESNNTFKQSIEKREGKQTYVFYEGPPTANGLPHAGHALGRTMKDFVARYKTMSGYQVLRKAGWDTHGLPVELEVQKQLNLKGKDDIKAYGIEAFIEKCKESVFTYEREWRHFTEALGYWVDMDDPYVTLQNPYIESVWNILSTIHRKDMLYKGHRVVPYCPNCETSLSSHEVAQGYKDVTDLSATAKFLMEGTENEYLLGWTTTPWTLPSNVAIAVNPDMTYVKVEKDEEVYVVAEALAEKLLGESPKIVAKLKGSELVGSKYDPPFDYLHLNRGHEVIGASFVTDSSGTGLVHMAPAHGDDDYQAIRESGLDFVNVVDSKGRYTEEIGPLAGRFVKDCDVDIVKMLAHNGRLFSKERYEHSYPHCWRCDSPLLYYAMEGWFIETTKVKYQLIANNQEVDWHPSHMREGRFGKFLENVVDWNIGRNRFWGTPLNVWECDSCDKQESPASIAELRERADQELGEDIELHKPFVDGITFTCECGGKMHRTSEVIDVWFDSGSMPFAQYHYPFENKELMNKQFPADVVIEGVDQTRGWFYSLLAVSTLFTGKAPYKRVLSLGHILDENGQKMSKSKGNALNPVELIEEFGADSLRWALLADSAPWNNKRFSKKTVSQTKSKVIDTLANVHSFYKMYAEIDRFNPKTVENGTATKLDEWILSRLNTVIAEVTKSLDAYDVTKGARTIASFLDEISNWYIRRSRARFWANGMDADKRAAYHTLYEVLTKTTQLMAPFAPFLSDEVYTDLAGNSVHLSDYPTANTSLVNAELEHEMDAVRQVVELTRSIRNQTSLKTKQPLAQLAVVPLKQSANLEAYRAIIAEETNVKTILLDANQHQYVSQQVKLNFPVAGPKLGKSVGLVQKMITQFGDTQTQQFLDAGKMILNLENDQIVELEKEDIILENNPLPGFEFAEGDDYLVVLDTNVTTELKEEGFVREFIRAVQVYRKELDLPVEKRVHLTINATEHVQDILTRFESFMKNHVLIDSLSFAKTDEMKYFNVEGEGVYLNIHM